jgi:outer membrane lipopolysaccharide assembly protein LptE/RlpB
MMKTFLCMAMALLVAGCGYHVPSADNSWLAQHGRTLCVELFDNRTVEPYLDSAVTDEVSLQVLRSRAVTLVEDCAAADLLLTGAVVDFESQAVAYDADDNVSEYRAFMTVEARLVRRSDGDVLWKERFRRSETYAASLAKSFQVGKESLAGRIVARRIGEDLMANLLAVF